MADVTRNVVLKIIVQAPTGISGLGRGPVAPLRAGPGMAGVSGAGPIGGVSPNYGSMEPGIPTAYSGINPYSGRAAAAPGGTGRYRGELPYDPYSGRAAAVPGGTGRYRGDVPYSPYSGRAAAAPGAVGRMRGEGLPGSPWSGMPSRLPSLGNVGRIRGDIEGAAKATEKWAEALGRVSLEGARLATWSRLITRVTFGIESLGAKAIGAAGIGAAGIAGAAGVLGAIDYSRGFQGARALRTPVGRAAFMDFYPGIFRGVFTAGGRPAIGARERGLLAEENIAAQERLGGTRAMQQAVYGTYSNIYGLRSQQQLSLLTGRSELAQAGIIPIGAQMAAVAGRYRRSIATERRLEREGQEFAAPPFAPSTRGTRYYERPRGGAAALPAGIGFGAGYTSQFTRPQGPPRPDLGPQATQALQNAERIRAALENASQNSERLARQWIDLAQTNLQNQKQADQERLRIVQQISEEESKRLADIRAARLSAAFGAVGIEPAVLRRATRQLEQIQRGGAIPRGARLTPELQFAFGALAPEAAQRLGQRIAGIPDIAAFLRAAGFEREIPMAEKAAKQAEEIAEKFQKDMNVRIAGLSKAIIDALEQVEINVLARRRQRELEREQAAAARQAGAAAPVPGQ